MKGKVQDQVRFYIVQSILQGSIDFVLKAHSRKDSVVTDKVIIISING